MNLKDIGYIGQLTERYPLKGMSMLTKPKFSNPKLLRLRGRVLQKSQSTHQLRILTPKNLLKILYHLRIFLFHMSKKLPLTSLAVIKVQYCTEEPTSERKPDSIMKTDSKSTHVAAIDDELLDSGGAEHTLYTGK